MVASFNCNALHSKQPTFSADPWIPAYCIRRIDFNIFSPRHSADNESIKRYPSSAGPTHTVLRSDLFPSHTFQTSFSTWLIVTRTHRAGSLTSSTRSATLAAPPPCRAEWVPFVQAESCLPENYVNLFPKPPPIGGLLSQSQCRYTFPPLCRPTSTISRKGVYRSLRIPTCPLSGFRNITRVKNSEPRLDQVTRLPSVSIDGAIQPPLGVIRVSQAKNVRQVLDIRRHRNTRGRSFPA